MLGCSSLSKVSDLTLWAFMASAEVAAMNTVLSLPALGASVT